MTAWMAQFALALVASSAPTTLPEFEFTNFDGREISSESLRGTTTVLVPTYAKCIFACPMVTFLLTELDKGLGAPEHVRYLHVSVQPEEDTFAEIAEHFEEHGIDTTADPRWLFANGPPESIRRFMDETGIELKRTEMEDGTLVEHTIRVFVVGPAGTLLRTYDTYFWNEEEMQHALRRPIEPSDKS